MLKSIVQFITGIVSLRGGTDNTIIGNSGDKLKVEADVSTNSSLTTTTGSKLRYIDMNVSSGGVARGTTITNATWVTVFSYSGSGLLFSMVLNLEDVVNWDVRIVADGEEMFTSNGIMTGDLADDAAYDLDNAAQPLSPTEGAIGLSLEEHNRFVWVCPNSFPLKYTTSVSVRVKRETGAASRKFNAGLVILSKET